MGMSQLPMPLAAQMAQSGASGNSGKVNPQGAAPAFGQPVQSSQAMFDPRAGMQQSNDPRMGAIQGGMGGKGGQPPSPQQLGQGLQRQALMAQAGQFAPDMKASIAANQQYAPDMKTSISNAPQYAPGMKESIQPQTGIPMSMQRQPQVGMRPRMRGRGRF